MSEMQDRVEKAIRQTLLDPYGAGSDLSVCEETRGSEWLEVEGNIDVPHLASHILLTLGFQ